MKKFIQNKTLLPLLITGLLIASGCSETEQEEQNEQLVKSVNVEVDEIKPTDFSSFLRLVGTIETGDDVQVSSEVSGRIENFFPDEGDMVKQGEIIAKVDDRKLQQEAR